MLFFAAFLTVFLSFTETANALDDVKFHSSGDGSIHTQIYRTAQERGFYKEEGLNVLIIAANSAAGIQGLIAGSFDFTGIFGVSHAAILRGAPLKSIMVFDTKPLWWIYGGRRIKTLHDLKGGKTIGITSLGANTDLITREALRANGIDPQRDVVIQPVGLGGTRVAALIAGTIDAAILNPMESLTVKKQGLNELVFLGDYDLAIAQGGVATRESLLRDNRDLVRRFVRATLRAFLWFRSNENEAVLKMSKAFNISKEEAAELYKIIAKNFTADGTISRELQQRIIAFQSTQLKLEKAIPPENVYDFSIVRAVHQEQKKIVPK